MLVRLFIEERRICNSGSISLMPRFCGNPLILIRLFEPSPKRSLCKRKNSFTILLALLRTTATPVFLRIVTANLLTLHRLSAARRTKCAVSDCFVHFAPRKSPLLSLSCFFRVRVIGHIIPAAVFWAVAARILSHSAGLYGETLPAFCPSAPYDFPARGCSHPHEKPMRSFSAFVVRLVSSFHLSSLF